MNRTKIGPGIWFGLVLLPLMLWEALVAPPLPRNWRQALADVLASVTSPSEQWSVYALIVGAIVAQLMLGLWKARAPGGCREALCTRWILVLVILHSAHYWAEYRYASQVPDSLAFVAGIWMGAILGRLRGQRPGQHDLTIIWGVIGMVLFASLFHIAFLEQFYYRGVHRSSGLWSNPNVYGMICATCLTASTALIASEGKYGTEHGDALESTRGTPRRLATVLLATAMILAAIGTVRSFSRGAWLGAGIGFLYLALQKWGGSILALRRLAKHGSRKHQIGWYLSSIAVVLLILGFAWSLTILKGVEAPLLRRIGTVANTTDASWRNRIHAWVGAARLTADRPIVGWGLNQIESAYNQLYKPKHLQDPSAIRLNDLLTVSASMGVPGAIALLALLYVALRDHARAGSPLVAPLLVLLVGTIFEGVLFRMALSIPFWAMVSFGAGSVRNNRAWNASHPTRKEPVTVAG